MRWNHFGIGCCVAALVLPLSGAATAGPNSWAGFYVGAHGGLDWKSGNDFTFRDPNIGGFDSLTLSGGSSVGALGGLQGGYNWQFAPSWLLGIEGDVSWTSINDTQSKAPLTAAGGISVFGSSLTMSSRVKWLASARVRLGYAQQNLLFYVTGGAAWANSDYSETLLTAVPPTNLSFNHTQPGWVLGGGTEWLMNSNWSLRAEYLFYSLDTIKRSQNFTGPFPPPLPVTFTWSQDVQVARLGLNYHFHGQ